MRSTRVLGLILTLASIALGSDPHAFLLSDDVHPVRHSLELTINPSAPTLEGWSRIDADLNTRTQTIELNGKNLTTESASVESGGLPIQAETALSGGEFIVIRTPVPVGPGRVRLIIHYRAPLSATAKSGPYRRSVNGRWYAFSMFTPIDARRAFPCFDEPRFKTPWEISIRVKHGAKAFSNSPPVAESDEPGGTKLIRFAPTPPLPAEVVAFAVGPFDIWDAGNAGSHNTPVKVITPAGESVWGKDAGIATQAVLPRLESYTGIPYPWAKLDHVALPEGAFGAVENPGIITYLAKGLLVSPQAQDRADDDRAIRALEAHEIGHQWFGNLVTQRTWIDVWLSEGFATWIAGKIMDEEEPPARHNLLAVSRNEHIMRHDDGRGFAVRSNIQSRKEMENVYNGTVYNKGAAILLMLENWLGAEPFRRGLQTYLHQHAFENASTEDLASALENTTHINARSVLFPYLDKKGVPHVSARLDCKPGDALLIFEETGADADWSVPVCWRGRDLSPACTVVRAAAHPTEATHLKTCPAWLYFNSGGTGYYRTDWTLTQIERFKPPYLNELTAPERLSFVYDLAALRQSSAQAQMGEKLLNQLALDPEPEIREAARKAVRHARIGEDPQ